MVIIEIKTIKDNKGWRCEENGTLVGMQIDTDPVENTVVSWKKIKNRTTATLLLSIRRKGNEISTRWYLYAFIHSNLRYLNNKYLWTDEWIQNKKIYIYIVHTHTYTSAMGKGILPYAITWRDLEVIILGKIYAKQRKTKTFNITCM